MSSDVDDEQERILVAEGHEVVRGCSADESILLWQALFWVFNIKTPKYLANLSWFLRSKVFGLKTDTAPSATAMAAIKQIEEYSR